MFKSLEFEKLRTENDNIGKRLEQKYIKYFWNKKKLRSNPTINNKIINENFMNYLNYKKFANKFDLPNIETKVPIILKRKLDISPYNRVRY